MLLFYHVFSERPHRDKKPPINRRLFVLNTALSRYASFGKSSRNIEGSRSLDTSDLGWPARSRIFLDITPQGFPRHFYFSIPMHLGL